MNRGLFAVNGAERLAAGSRVRRARTTGFLWAGRRPDVLVNCWFQAYDYAVYVPAASTATDWTFAHCNAARSAKEAFLFGNGAGWVLDNSVIMNNGCATTADGVAVGASVRGIRISNSTFYNGNQPGETACARRYGVHVYSGAANVKLINLDVGQAGRTNGAAGIAIDAGADYFKLDDITALGYGGKGVVNLAGTGRSSVDSYESWVLTQSRSGG